MNILYLTFYFEPDLCAGSFRNTPLVKELSLLLNPDDIIHVVTTMPNRYQSYTEKTIAFEKIDNIEINRVNLPQHKNGFIDQSLAFLTFFLKVLHLTRSRKYDLVFASSSRLFTAFLGRIISRQKNIPIYLDVRDIFVDTLHDVLKKSIIRWPLLHTLKLLERYTFSGANHINLISGGFKSYFVQYKNVHYSFFSNGIDTEFLKMPPSSNWPVDKYIITYAGNIGEGQGLHKIIPQAANMLGPKYHFRIIGDGGMKNTLIDHLQAIGVNNVEFIQPMSREKLKNYYLNSHFLFLHLNNYKAFEKVLPSKIFEYGALDKPIIAGVGGYASNFINQNLSNYILFLPGDAESMVNQLKSFTFKYEQRLGFRKTFDREQINKQMAKSIIVYVGL